MTPEDIKYCADPKSDDEDTQPLTPTPMFKDDEDIYIQDDGKMLIKQDHGN